MDRSIKYRSSLKQNVATVCKCLGLPKPSYTDIGESGYICRWGSQPFVKQFGLSYSYQAVAQIFKQTGINCLLTSAGNLIVPYSEGGTYEDSSN